MAEPAISVVVVAYREREVLAECLAACLDAAAAVPGGAELIVVDNGGLAPFIRERWPDVRLIEPGGNVGFAGGVQRGVAVASGEWVALVNDDARIERDALARLLTAGERDEQIGSIAAQVRFHSDPALINSAGIDVDSLGIATERLAGRPAAEAQNACEVFGVSGCFALYRTAMLDAVGGLDERFFAYLEDVDLAWRARAAGWIAVYEPLAVAYHHGSASSGEGSQRKYFLVGRNRVRLLARNATHSAARALAPGDPALRPCLCRSTQLSAIEPSRRCEAVWRDCASGASLRRESSERRRPVKLSSARKGWLRAFRQHRAYRELGSSDTG